jgi:hypothetical protein
LRIIQHGGKQNMMGIFATTASAKKAATFIKSFIGILTVVITIAGIVNVMLEKKNSSFSDVLDELSSKLLGD